MTRFSSPSRIDEQIYYSLIWFNASPSICITINFLYIRVEIDRTSLRIHKSVIHNSELEYNKEILG